MRAVDGRKVCSTCRVDKPVAEFVRCRRNVDGLQMRCRSCHKVAITASAEKYREQHREYVRRTVAALRVWVASLKDGPCTDCGGRFPAVCMDWDHTGTDKIDAVSVMVREKRSRARILAEIAKCELVCSNCHRIRTQTRLDAAR